MAVITTVVVIVSVTVTVTVTVTAMLWRCDIRYAIHGIRVRILSENVT